MRSTTEAFARVRTDALTTDAAWSVIDRVGVLCKHALYVGAHADYVFCDRPGHLPAAIRAKRASIDAIAARDQGHRYAEQPNVPFVVLSHGEDVSVLDRLTGVHARKLAGFRSQPQGCP